MGGTEAVVGLSLNDVVDHMLKTCSTGSKGE